MTFESRLIAEVKRYECLYNFKALNYKDIAFKDKLWEKVAKACGASVEECKKRWKHLRDCYTRSKRRELELSRERRTQTQKEWRYKNQMDFLTQCTKTRRAVDNSNISDDDWCNVATLSKSASNNVIAKNEETDAEEGNVEDMNEINEKIEINVGDDFQPDIDTNSLEETMFPSFMESYVPADGEVLKEEDSTTLMFRMLDRKVKQYGLSEEQLSDLETSVILFVYKKIAEYKK